MIEGSFFKLFHSMFNDPLTKVLVIALSWVIFKILTKFKSDTDQALSQIQPIIKYVGSLRADIDALKEKLSEHQTSLGNANKAIKGDFLNLSKEVKDSALEIRDLVNQVRYDFLDTQKDTVKITERVSSILKDLDQKYKKIESIEQDMNLINKNSIAVDKEVNWIKNRIDQNKESLENIKNSLEGLKNKN